MDRYAELKKLIKDFERLQNHYKKFGALDTEPDLKFQLVLVKALNGEDYLPETPIDWELYTCKSGSDKVAVKLTEAAGKVRDFIRETSIADSRDIRDFISDYCWRCGDG